MNRILTSLIIFMLAGCANNKMNPDREYDVGRIGKKFERNGKIFGDLTFRVTDKGVERVNTKKKIIIKKETNVQNI